MKPCLHSAEEFPLKGLDEAGMADQLRRAILAKPRCHDALGAANRSKSLRGMSQIGG